MPRQGAAAMHTDDSHVTGLLPKEKKKKKKEIDDGGASGSLRPAIPLLMLWRSLILPMFMFV